MMIELRQHKGLAARRFYRIAGQHVSSDVSLSELQGFRSRERLDPGTLRVDRPTGLAATRPQIVFRGPVALGHHHFDLECSSLSEGLALTVADQGRITISGDGEHIAVEPCATAQPSAINELVLGPSLTLALAMQNVWCLHASAVEIDGHLVAFLAVSGTGKSTLARALPDTPSGPFRLAADDVLPVAMDRERVQALPRFPQLKYRPDQQPGIGLPASLGLAGIYLLDTEGSPTGIELERITGHAAALALVRHTHCASLFTSELLLQHLDFCALLATQIPIWRLAYPKRLALLPWVAKLLQSQHRSEPVVEPMKHCPRPTIDPGRTVRPAAPTSTIGVPAPRRLPLIEG
ncbi:MAG: hypothetical protein AAF657_28950 [Acidobacteriota bacterium]